MAQTFHLQRLEIDRSKWACAGHYPEGVEEPKDNRLLHPDGSMCCLGFYTRALGVQIPIADSDITVDSEGFGYPPELDAYRASNAYASLMGQCGSEHGVVNVFHDAAQLNDDDSLTDDEREAKIAAYFAAHGLAAEVAYTGQYPD